MINRKNTHKEVVGGILVAALFLLAVAVSRTFSDDIAGYLDFGFVGMAIYVAAGIVATVAAPLTTVPLIPIASALWGPFTTGVLSIFSWTLGSIIAFIFARRLGQPFVSKFIDLAKIAKYEKVLGRENIFFDIVFLRMAVPVDILSYAIGLFTSVKFGTYVAATIIGIAPFAFILAYAAEASLKFQAVVGALVVIMLYAGYRRIRQGRALKTEVKE